MVSRKSYQVSSITLLLYFIVIKTYLVLIALYLKNFGIVSSRECIRKPWGTNIPLRDTK
jgi:hypothetical protein